MNGGIGLQLVFLEKVQMLDVESLVESCCSKVGTRDSFVCRSHSGSLTGSEERGWPLETATPFRDSLSGRINRYGNDRVVSAWSAGADGNGVVGEVAPSLQQLRSNQPPGLLLVSLFPPVLPPSFLPRHAFPPFFRNGATRSTTPM